MPFYFFPLTLHVSCYLWGLPFDNNNLNKSSPVIFWRQNRSTRPPVIMIKCAFYLHWIFFWFAGTTGNHFVFCTRGQTRVSHVFSKVKPAVSNTKHAPHLSLFLREAYLRLLTLIWIHIWCAEQCSSWHTINKFTQQTTASVNYTNLFVFLFFWLFAYIHWVSGLRLEGAHLGPGSLLIRELKSGPNVNSCLNPDSSRFISLKIKVARQPYNLLHTTWGIIFIPY